MLDDVLLDIEPVDLSADGLEILDRLAEQPEAAWYRRRRRLALAAAGFVAAGYNPMQPRGKDGKWIETFAWIRWLVDGKWRRGQVKGWSPKDGSVLVKGDDGANHVFSKQDAAEQVYTLPTPKATMKLPQPGGTGGVDTDAPGFFKIGGQGGSNPGGMWQVTEPAVVEADSPVTPSMLETALNFHGLSSKMQPLIAPTKEDDLATWLATEPQLKTDNALILDRSTNRVFSKLGGSWWDLGTNQQVVPQTIFGAPGSSRRGEIVGKLDVVDGKSMTFSDLTGLITTAKALTGPKPGKDDRFYIKRTKSPDHAKNEALANFLYELGGVPVPETSVGSDGLTFASKIVEGEEIHELSEVVNVPSAFQNQNVIDQLKENFAFDAWLANWDVIGMVYDNVKVVDGVPFRIDAGGALRYRAKGDPKGQIFGDTVGELDTLIDPSYNPSAAAIYKGITWDQVRKGVERLAAITPQDIKNAVSQYDLDQSMADTLIARRKFILDKYAVDEPPIDVDKLPTLPPVLPPPEVLPPLPDSPSLTDEPTPKVFPQDISGMYWNVDAGNFMPGDPPKDTVATIYANYIDSFDTEHQLSEVASWFATGNEVFVTSNNSMWHVDNVTMSAGIVTLDLSHGMTGEKTKLSMTDWTKIPAEKVSSPEAAEDMRDTYSQVYRQYRNSMANRFTNLPQMWSAAAAVGLKTQTIKADNAGDIKPGDWLIDAIDPGKPVAFKVSKIDFGGMNPPLGGYKPSLVTVEGTNMSGDEIVPRSLNYFVRRQVEGGVMDDVLDAIQARNIVAKTGDHNDANAPSPVAVENTPTPSDTVMQKLSASGDSLPSGDAPADPEAPPTEEEPEWFDPDTQVNKNLTVVGDFIFMPDLDQDSAEALVGKKFYHRYITKMGGVRERGVFTLVAARPYYKSNPEYGLELDFQDATGRIIVKRTKQTMHGDHSGFGGEMIEVEGNIAPILQYTEKANGDVVVNGEIIGQWRKIQNKDKWGYYGSASWGVTISGKYTTSGKDFEYPPGGVGDGYSKKKSIKPSIVPLLLPPGAGGSKPKTVKVKEIQKKIVLQQIAFGSKIKETTAEGNAVTLMDGAEVKLGMWVISKTDGKIGKIVATKVSPEAGVTGSVKVEYDDPFSPTYKTVKIRGASTLSAAINPEGEVPPNSPLFSKVKLADGSQPFPSQEVLDGTTPVVIMGIKPDGNMRVIYPDGTKVWVKASKLTKGKDYSKDVVVEVDAEPAGAIAAGLDSWKTAPKAKKIPYAAPGGAVITQPSNAVELYRQYDPSRKLTKDNFVPRIGMYVRDNKGTQFVIVRQNKTTDSNPSTVFVIEPGVPGKPRARQPNTLWVDHAAELATDDGKPLPKISKIHNTLGTDGSDQTFPDGSTVYTYVWTESNYGKKSDGTMGYIRTKSTRYFIIQPNGQARRITAGGATALLEPWLLQNIVQNKAGVKKVAYVDSTSSSMMTLESNPGKAQHSDIDKVWIHDSAPGALEALKTAEAKDDITVAAPETGVLLTDVEPEKFGGDQGALTPLGKPSDAPDPPANTAGPPPPPIQSDPVRLAQVATVPKSYSIGTGITQLKKQMTSGQPGDRVLYAMGDTDYIEDMAIRIQSAITKAPGAGSAAGPEMIEVRFRLLEDKVDDLGNRLITNLGNTKTGGWIKTPMKTPKDIVPGDHISVKISSVLPEKNPDGTTGGALKPTELGEPNATVINPPVLVGKTKAGLEAYRIDVMTAGGAVGSLIVENRATPSLVTYEWDPNKIIATSYFDSKLNADAASMGWTVRNDHSSGYETTTGWSAPDAEGRKVINPTGKSVRTTGQSTPNGAYRLRYDAGEGSYMTVQVTHPAAEKRPPNIFKHGGSPSTTASIRHSVNGEVLIRVPADDPNALAKISEMMSAAGVPPEAQGQPTGRQIRQMALHKVFKQFNPTYTHMQRPDVTGDSDASAQAVLSLIDAQVKQYMPNQRNATMDDIELRVTPNGRMEVILSDDVARALTAKGNFRFVYHQLNGGYNPLIWTSKSETGLLSTDERWSAGIVVQGGSSESDVTHDAGNRLYFRLSAGNTLHGDIVLSPNAMNKKLDNYWSPDDYWGRRHPENTAKEYLQATSFAGTNEIKIKRLIDPAMMAFVLMDSSLLTQRINELKAAGITHINGRPVEDIFVSPSMRKVGDVDDLGMHYGDEIPITSIPLEGAVQPGTPAATPAPTVIASGGTMTGSIIYNSSSDSLVKT